jgi:hypothetical protein
VTSATTPRAARWLDNACLCVQAPPQAAMQPLEDFMREFFRERTATYQKELEILAPFRRKFYTEDCRRAGRDQKLKEIMEESNSEELVQVSDSGTTGEAITVLTSRTGDPRRQRYHLQAEGDRWLIQEIEVECFSCRGENGNRDCIDCKGTGWFLGNRLSRPALSLPRRNTSSPPRQRRF